MQIQLQLMRKRVDRQKTEVLLKRQWEQYLEQGAAARTRTSSQCGLKSTRTMRGHHVGSEATATATESARGAARSSQRPKKRSDSNYDSSGDDTTSDDGDESKQQQEGGGSPLHLALEKKLPAAVSLALLARRRDAAKVSDSVGNYPLMIALKSSAATALCCLAKSGRHEERRGRDCAVPCHAKMPRKQWWTQYELRHQIVRCFQPF